MTPYACWSDWAPLKRVLRHGEVWRTRYFFPVSAVLLFSPSVYDLQWYLRSQLNRTHFWGETKQCKNVWSFWGSHFPFNLLHCLGWYENERPPVWNLMPKPWPQILKLSDSKTGEPRNEVGGWCWFQKFLQHLGIDRKRVESFPKPGSVTARHLKIGLFGPQKGKKTSRHDFFRGYLLRLRGLMPIYVWTLLMLKQDRRYMKNPSKITLVDSGWRGSLEIILLVFGRLPKKSHYLGGGFNDSNIF